MFLQGSWTICVSGTVEMEGKAGQPVWDLREPSETESAVDDPLQESFSMFFHLHGHRSVQRKSRFQYLQHHFFTAVSWTYTLCPMPLCWNQPLLRGENRINFVNVRSPSEGFSGASCSCFPLVEGTATFSQAVRKMRKLLLSAWKRAFVQSSAFAMSTRACRELPSGTRL